MALNTTGPISMGGTVVGQSINLELGKAATATISMDDVDVRALTGTTAGTAVSLGNAQGTIAGPVSFFMLINANSAKDDNFTVEIEPYPSGTVTSLSGTADFNYNGEQTTYLWLGPGLGLSGFLARPGVTAMIAQYAANPVYRGTFSFPVVLSLGQSYTVRMTNVQNNGNANFGRQLLGISGTSAVSFKAASYSGQSGVSFAGVIALPNGP